MQQTAFDFAFGQEPEAALHVEAMMATDPLTVPSKAPTEARLETFADADTYICNRLDWSYAKRSSTRSTCRRAAWSLAQIRARARNLPIDPNPKRLELASVPFDVGLINQAWNGKSHRAAGFEAARSFRNAKSVIRQLGREFGKVVPCRAPGLSSVDPFGPLLVAANDYDRSSMRRFIGWLHEQGLSPPDVTADTLLQYKAFALTSMVGVKIDDVLRMIAGYWNKIGEAVPDWPHTTLSAPRLNERYSLPFTSYPESFQSDIDTLCAWMAATNCRGPFRKGGRKRAMRPASIKTRLGGIRRAAWALVANGRSPASITSLRCLVTEPAMEEILTYYWERGRMLRQAMPEGDRDPNPTHSNAQTAVIGATLIMIAEHHCGFKGDQLDTLKELAKEVRLPPQDRLSPKNRKRLRQFDDRSKKARLLLLGRSLMKQALGMRNLKDYRPDDAARLARTAIAIAILCRIPLRIKNLHAIRLGVNLVFSGGRSDIVTVCFEPDESKNWLSLEFYVGPRLHALLQTYINEFLPIFAAESADFAEKQWLFPSGEGRSGPLSIDRLRKAITKSIDENVGATVNPHLFRSLAVTWALEHSPAALEQCRQLLGDKTLEVILSYYSGLDQKEAARRHSLFVDAEEDRLAALVQPRQARRGSVNT